MSCDGFAHIGHPW